MANFTPDLKPYTGQGKFRYWVQMVLPTIYDDSLSYMELLNKVVYALNLAIEDVGTVEENVQSLLEAFNELQQFTNDYFDNLDVQQEINNKLDQMAEDGTLSELLEPYFEFLQDYNIRLSVVEERLSEITNLPEGSTAGDAELADIRIAYNGRSYDTAGDSVRGQFYSLVDGNAANLLSYFKTQTKTQGNVTFTPNNDGSIGVSGTATSTALFDFFNKTNQLPDWYKAGLRYQVRYKSAKNIRFRIYGYVNGSLETIINITGNGSFIMPSNIDGMIIRLQVTNGTVTEETVKPELYACKTNEQLTEDINNIQNYERVLSIKSAASYIKTNPDTEENYYDLNDFVIPGLYLLDTSTKKENAPEGRSNFNALEVYAYATSNPTGFIRQRLCNITTSGDVNDTVYERYKNAAGFKAWIKGGAGSGNINYNTFVQNTYNDTYNVTATPEITPVSDYYLQPSGDSTDRTNDIETLLNTIGVCRLGAGDYYIKNGITMPNNTSIIGVGRATRLILDDTVEDGNIINVGSYCTVESLTLYGGIESYRPTSASVVGTRNGIAILGDATSTSSATYANKYCQLSNLYFIGFTGSAILGYRNNGGGSFNANNIDIYGCGAGINILENSEYHAFSNVRTRWCRYGCINNGGNNLFSNCHFDTCIQALKMDNSLEDKTNNSHGGMINCTFNHNDSNAGIAIEVINMANGFQFNNCQIFYGSIIFNDVKGIIFANNNLGTNINITITGCYSVLFNNNLFGNTPTINQTANTSLIMQNNYIRNSGQEITI